MAWGVLRNNTLPEVTALKWDYDMKEIIADGIVHAVGVTIGIVSISALLVTAAPAVGAWEFMSLLVGKPADRKKEDLIFVHTELSSRRVPING